MKTLKTFILAVFAFIAASTYSNASFADEIVILKTFDYEIRKNDNLIHLAKRFDTTKAKLLAANTGSRCIKNENLILRGCKLNVPSLYPAAKVEEALQKGNENVMRLKLANIALTKSNSKLSFMLSGVGIIAGFLFIGLLVIMVRTAAFKENMENKLKESETTVEERGRALKDQETDLIGLKLWRDGAVNQINNLKTRLSLKTEELSLQEGSQEEIKRLKTENDSLVLKLNEHMRAVDRLYFENGGMESKINILDAQLAMLSGPKDYVEVKTQENGILKFNVHTVYCKHKDCKVTPMLSNATSHHFKPHTQAEEPGLKETVDRT